MSLLRTWTYRNVEIPCWSMIRPCATLLLAADCSFERRDAVVGQLDGESNRSCAIWTRSAKWAKKSKHRPEDSIEGESTFEWREQRKHWQSPVTSRNSRVRRICNPKEVSCERGIWWRSVWYDSQWKTLLRFRRRNTRTDSESRNQQ